MLFAEAGYKSYEGAAIEPWDWNPNGAKPSERVQADCYRALFEALWGKPWFAGVYWWKYFTVPDPGRYGEDLHFTPAGKRAEGVLREWYRGKPKAAGD